MGGEGCLRTEPSLPVLVILGTAPPSPSLLAPGLTSLTDRKEYPAIPIPRPLSPCPKHQGRRRSYATLSWKEEACPGPLCLTRLPVVASGGDLLCWCLFSSGFQRQ